MNDWIPISVEEPTTADHVLVSTNTGSVFELDYVVTKHDASMNYIAKETLDSIVAWMPLPAPYKVENE